MLQTTGNTLGTNMGNAENLYIYNTAGTAGYGNALNNIISGYSRDDSLYGNGGNDYFYGSDGTKSTNGSGWL